MSSQRSKATAKSATGLSAINQKLGALIHKARVERSLPAETVASYVGISVQTLLAYESGEKPIPLVRIYALANCLNIDPDQVLNLLK